MIVDERMRTYINSLDMGNTPFLEELEQYAIRERVPIIRREMQSFIKMFLAVNRPKRILEVGTAIGFSTLLMCEYGPEDLEIVTIENYEKRIPIAKENFRRAGREAQITLLEGDAGQILKELEEKTGCRYRTIHVVGGGANAGYLNRLTAEKTGRTVLAGPTEATAIGNLAVQMITGKECSNLKDARNCIFHSFEIKQYEP